MLDSTIYYLWTFRRKLIVELQPNLSILFKTPHTLNVRLKPEERPSWPQNYDNTRAHPSDFWYFFPPNRITTPHSWLPPIPLHRKPRNDLSPLPIHHKPTNDVRTSRI
jgi:hypothetical protein